MNPFGGRDIGLNSKTIFYAWEIHCAAEIGLGDFLSSLHGMTLNFPPLDQMSIIMGHPRP